jgi:penicillin amidase
MPDRRRPLLRLSLIAVAIIAALTLLAGGWFYAQLKRSLPALDGSLAVAGLSAPVVVERDDLGAPTVRGASRADVARALGFLHAQDRFFQMDLSRRRAAGELAELVGKAALPLDREARTHDFRNVAQQSFAQLSALERAWLEAYAAGVNAGLDQLRAKPFEYLALRSAPAPWLAEDSILVAHSMWLDLQDSDGRYEQTLSALRDTLGNAAVDFFAPLVAPDDAALDDSTAPLPAIPGPRALDLRKRAAAVSPIFPDETPRAASNSFAVSGGLMASGAPLLANDMHLTLRVPNVWYRASLVFPDATGTERRVTGVTLPGLPFVIAGSNGRIAWGFTNSNTDGVDLVAITASDLGREFYILNGETIRLPKRTVTIRVKGEAEVTHEFTTSPWGPIVGENAKGQRLALQWVAHNPAATNLTLGEFETAHTAEEAVAIAHRAGLPAQNLLVVDADGALAWTIAGKLPRRVGFDGRLPVSWSFGDRKWDGFVPAEQIPTIFSPPARVAAANAYSVPTSLSYLFTANQRLLGESGLTILGDGGYDPPLRAARIRQRLDALAQANPKATPRDLLAVQLDAHAPHLNRWRELMLGALGDDAVAQNKKRADLRAALAPWTSEASIDSASYRLVRSFRRHLVARVFTPIFGQATALYPDFNLARLRYEPALWRLLKEKPPHLLDPAYPTWDAVVLTAVDDVLNELDAAGLAPAEATWGKQNVARIVHPLSAVLPGFLARRLDMPREPLPGDRDLPRVQTPTHGASQRFVVAPGREVEGIFHQPGGASAHPLSPFYRAGHEAWARGDPTPFLPGATRHTLRLTP